MDARGNLFIFFFSLVIEFACLMCINYFYRFFSTLARRRMKGNREQERGSVIYAHNSNNNAILLNVNVHNIKNEERLLSIKCSAIYVDARALIWVSPPHTLSFTALSQTISFREMAIALSKMNKSINRLCCYHPWSSSSPSYGSLGREIAEEN